MFSLCTWTCPCHAICFRTKCQMAFSNLSNTYTQEKNTMQNMYTEDGSFLKNWMRNTNQKLEQILLLLLQIWDKITTIHTIHKITIQFERRKRAYRSIYNNKTNVVKAIVKSARKIRINQTRTSCYRKRGKRKERRSFIKSKTEKSCPIQIKQYFRRLTKFE